jgi:dihydroflavonol-4-reductase
MKVSFSGSLSISAINSKRVEDAVSGKLLVTGASGLVGANLVRNLFEQGREVCAVVHEDRRALEGLDVETISADVRDRGAIEYSLTGVEVVFHLAGSISLEMNTGKEMKAVNTLGTRNVVNACLKRDVRRLIHFSSIDALRQTPYDQPVDENRALVDEDCSEVELARIPPYNLTKAWSEREVLAGMEAGLDAVIIRPTAMLGSCDFKPSYLGQALIQLAQGKIPALVKSGFNWVDVRDVVAGAIRAEQVAPPGARYILGGNWHTIREVAELVAVVTKRAAPRITVPMWLAEAFSPVMLKLARFNGSHPIYTRVTLNALRSNRRVSCNRSIRELGYSARPLDNTIRDTLTWFQERGYLHGKLPWS